MNEKNFGLKEGEIGDKKRFKVSVNSDGDTIHSAHLLRIENKSFLGMFKRQQWVFVADLMLPTRRVEDEILATRAKLEQLEIKRKTTEQEGINLICTFENVFDGKSFINRLKSKAKGKSDKPKTRSVEVALVQSPKQPPRQQSGKPKNANGQH